MTYRPPNLPSLSPSHPPLFSQQSDVSIKRKKVKTGKENKLGRRNTICQSTCHNQLHCNRKGCEHRCGQRTSIANSGEANNEGQQQINCGQRRISRLDERRRSTGSVNLIDSCCQTEESLDNIGQNYISHGGNKKAQRCLSQQLACAHVAVDGKSCDNHSNQTSNLNKVVVQAQIHCDPLQRLRVQSKQSNDDARSSSGNWSASNATGSETSPPTTEGGSCASLLSAQMKDSATESLEESTNAGDSLQCDTKTPSESETSQATEMSANNHEDSDQKPKLRNRPKPIQFANRDSESWLQYFERVDSNDTITNLDANSSIHRSHNENKSNVTFSSSCCSSIRPVNGSLDADELLSIYSEDTDGYYTSMHTDSGLFRSQGNSTMTSATSATNTSTTGQNGKGSHSALATFANTSISKSLNESETESSNRTLSNSTDWKSTSDQKSRTSCQKSRTNQSKPCPPVRSCSTLSRPINDLSGTTDNSCCDSSLMSEFSSFSNLSADQSERTHMSVNDNTDSCSTLTSLHTEETPPSTSPSRVAKYSQVETFYATESETESVGQQFRVKTSIDSTHYPSMVAMSDCERSTQRTESPSSVDTYSNAIGTNDELESLHQLSRSSINSGNSCRSSTLGSYASLTRLKELLKPLRRFGGLSKNEPTKEQRPNNIRRSLSFAANETPDKGGNFKRKGSFIRFPSFRTKSNKSQDSRPKALACQEDGRQQLWDNSFKTLQNEPFLGNHAVGRLGLVSETQAISAGGLAAPCPDSTFVDAHQSNSNVAQMVNRFEKVAGSGCSADDSTAALTSLNGPFCSNQRPARKSDVFHSNSFAKLFPVGRTTKVAPVADYQSRSFGQPLPFGNHVYSNQVRTFILSSSPPPSSFFFRLIKKFWLIDQSLCPFSS